MIQDSVRSAGVLLREGIGGERTPLLQVFDLGALSPKRQASDLLPYLPKFRHLFGSLPQNWADMSLRVTSIPLVDLECVTTTTVKVRGPTWYLRVKKGNIDNNNRLILQTC